MWENKKVSFVRQTTFSECGLCCISMVCSYFGYHNPISFYRNKFSVGRDGINMTSMIDVLSNCGIIAEAYHTHDFESLRKDNNPCIIHLKSTHYIVAVFGRKKVKVYDPSQGIYNLAYNELNKLSSGYFLSLSIASNFEKNTNKLSDFRYIVPKIKKAKKLFFEVTILSIISYIFTLSIPLIIQKMIDEITMNKEVNINSFILLLVLVFLIFLLVSFIYSHIFIKLQQTLYRSISKETVLHLFNVNYSYFDDRSTGNILFRTNILKEIQTAITSTMSQIIISCSSLVAMMIFFTIYYTQVAIMILIILFLFAFIIFKLNKQVMFVKKEELTSQESIQNLLTEIVSNMFQIRCIRIIDYFYNSYNNFFEKFMIKYKISQTWTLLSNQAINAIVIFLPAFIIFMLLILVDYSISVGQIFSIYTILNNVFAQFLTFITSISSILLLKTTLQYYNDMMDEPSKMQKKTEEPLEFTQLEIKNLWFKYNNNSDYVLKNINIFFKKGEKIAIIGASGSGKTTLIKLLTELYTPSKGKIQVMDDNQKYYEINSLGISVLPQNPLIFNKTIRENLVLDDISLTEKEIIDSLKKTRIWDEINSMPLKLDTIISSQGSNISGGQMQRIAIARALLRKPKIIILDEATSSLDVENEYAIYNMLKKENITQLIITHRLTSVEDANKIYFMKNGEILASGDHKQLYKNCQEYRDMCTLTQLSENLSD